MYDFISEMNTDMLFIEADHQEELNAILEEELAAEIEDAFGFVFPTDEEIELMAAVLE